MRTRFLGVSLAVLMAVGVGAPLAQAQAYNQPNDQNYQAQQQDYQDRQQDYQAKQQDYQAQQDNYRDAQSQYQDQKAAYMARRDAYLRDRDAYDARYGQGAFYRYWHDRHDEYDVRYGVGAWEHDYDGPVAYGDPHAVWVARHDAWVRDREAYDRYHGEGAFVIYWRDHPGDYDVRYGAGAYEHDYGAPVAYEGRDESCRQHQENHEVAGAVIGGLAGAALGSNVASGGGRTGGALIGGALGVGAGAAIGRDSAHCD